MGARGDLQKPCNFVEEVVIQFSVLLFLAISPIEVIDIPEPKLMVSVLAREKSGTQVGKVDDLVLR